MPRQLTIDIRPVRADDVGALSAAERRRADIHEARLANASWKDATYLSAWIDELPVGWVLVWWPDRFVPGRCDECAERLGCVAIEDLYVIEAARRRGVATALLDEAERRARHRGHATVGLGVGIDNVPARTLYERRGYRDTDFGVFIESGSTPDGAWVETQVCLVKEL